MAAAVKNGADPTQFRRALLWSGCWRRRSWCWAKKHRHVKMVGKLCQTLVVHATRSDTNLCWARNTLRHVKFLSAFFFLEKEKPDTLGHNISFRRRTRREEEDEEYERKERWRGRGIYEADQQLAIVGESDQVVGEGEKGGFLPSACQKEEHETGKHSGKKERLTREKDKKERRGRRKEIMVLFFK